MRTETIDKISVKYGVQSAVNSLEIPYKTENFREKGVNDKQDKSIIRLPRQNPYFCLKRLKIKAFEE